MSGRPRVTGAELIAGLQKAGFTVIRIKGSHHMMRHADGSAVSVPVHPGRDMPKGTLRGILVIVGMDIEELRERL